MDCPPIGFPKRVHLAMQRRRVSADGNEGNGSIATEAWPVSVTVREEATGVRRNDNQRTPPPTPDPSRPSGVHHPRPIGHSAARIALVYLAVALGWILLSDRLVGALVTDHDVLTQIQSFKGAAFVTGSALLIFVLLRRELRRREEARSWLKEADARYRSLVEQIPAVVYLAGFGLSNGWLYVSPKISEVLGYRQAEWMSQSDPLAARLHPEDRERVLRAEALSRSGSPFHCEYRVQARDGHFVWIRDEAVPVPGVPGLWQGVMLDVSAHKQTEEVLRLTVASLRETDAERRELLSRLVTAREEEHRRIASDVHDGPVQKLVAVGLRLGVLRRRLEEPPDLATLDEAAHTLDVATAELRHLLFELAPPVLEREGLASAVQVLLVNLAGEAGLETNLEVGLEVDPGEPVRTTCFRIVEEALRNVRKYAQANRVEVLLQGSGEGQVHVKVSDDGVGFDPEDGVKPGHFGLQGMRERSELAGGRFQVHSVPGRGTRVEFWVPRRSQQALTKQPIG